MVKMTIILPHPIFSRDSGNIRTLELLKHKPDDFKVTILYADFQTDVKQDNVDLLNDLSSANLLSVKSLDHKIYSMDLKPPLSTFLLWFVKPFLIRLEWAINRKKLKFLSDEDVIYLFDNTYSEILPSTRAFILGSNHAFIYERLNRYGFREFVTKFAAKLTFIGVLNHRISGYHLFPGMIDLVGAAPKKYITLPLGIISNEYHVGRRNGKPKFLFAAQLKEGKGILTIIEAWKLSGLGSSASLEVCGWGPLAEQLRSLNLHGINFHGYVSDRDLRDIYSECDIFLYPTRGDNYGFTILEALVSGMKVLTTKIMKGLFDDFESSDSLEYIEDNPESFSRRMVFLAAHIDQVRDNAKQTRELAIKQNDLKFISNKFFDFCRQSASERLNSRWR